MAQSANTWRKNRRSEEVNVGMRSINDRKSDLGAFV